MNEERLLQVILTPHTSEKAAVIADKHKQITFKVALNAHKHEVKAAIEKLFKVDVEDVRIVRVKGKTKRFGQAQGKRSDWKKAYVKLKPGQDIDFGGAAA